MRKPEYRFARLARVAIFGALQISMVLGLGGCAAPERNPEVGRDSESSQTRNPVSRAATLNDREVHYLDAGDGAVTLLLVHGWASDHSVWRHQLEGLARDARLLVVDLPGHGESEPPVRDYSMDLFADALAAVLDDAGVDRAVAVGHSNGTPAVHQFVRRHPDRVLGMVAVDGALEKMFTDELVEAMKQSLSSADYLDVVEGFIDDMPGDGLPREERSRIKSMAVATPQEALLGSFLAGADPDIWTEEPIAVPLQLILARQPAWTEAYEKRIRKRAPQADYRVLDDVSHFLMMERPEEFNRLLLEFLSANGWH